MIEFLLKHVHKSVHNFKMVLKRTVTIDADSRPPKKRNVNLSNKVNNLSRVVSRMKPEVRQESEVYTLTSVATDGATQLPIPLIFARSLQDAGTQEIRLHRIRVAWSYAGSDQQNWAVMYAPILNTASLLQHGLYNPALPHSSSNYQVPIDSTNARVYKTLNLPVDKDIKVGDTNSIMVMDHRFNIPKKIRFAEEGGSTTPIDQIYLIGGPKGASFTQYCVVTLWYTNN